MVSYFVSKDKRFRGFRSSAELLSMRRRFFLLNSEVSNVEKQKIGFLFFCKLKHLMVFSVRNKNRCVITARSGSVFRYFRMSRIFLKNFASKGLLTGVSKSSW